MEPEFCGLPDEALEKLEARRSFDVVIIDYKMPRVNGLDLAKKIRQRLGDDTPPMILLTSLTPTEPAFWSRIRGAGFASIIAKPAKSSQLLHALSAAVAEGGTTDRHKDVVEAATAGRRALSILLVDDNRINRKVGQKLLAKNGFEVEMASDGAEAVRMAADGNYDIVLMDIEMPEMDGIEATSRIRNMFEAERHPFIVALTANAETSARETYMNAGMNDYLSKPVVEAELLACIERGEAFRALQKRVGTRKTND